MRMKRMFGAAPTLCTPLSPADTTGDANPFTGKGKPIVGPV